MIARLSILMFLQYAVMGAWVPLFSLHLKERGFTPAETAWCCATAAMGALLAPLPWGQIADRWLAAQKCISLCSASAAVYSGESSDTGCCSGMGYHGRLDCCGWNLRAASTR